MFKKNNKQNAKEMAERDIELLHRMGFSKRFISGVLQSQVQIGRTPVGFEQEYLQVISKEICDLCEEGPSDNSDVT